MTLSLFKECSDDTCANVSVVWHLSTVTYIVIVIVIVSFAMPLYLREKRLYMLSAPNKLGGATLWYDNKSTYCSTEKCFLVSKF